MFTDAIDPASDTVLLLSIAIGVSISPGMIALAYSAKKPAVTPAVIVASTRTVVRTPSMAPSRSPSP